MNRESQDPQEKAAVLRQLKQKRAFLDSGLPIYDSTIGIAIFIVLCEYELRGQHPRLKDIHLEVSRSQGAVRRLVRELVKDGWVDLKTVENDNRSRIIVPTARMKKTIGAYLETLKG